MHALELHASPPWLYSSKVNTYGVTPHLHFQAVFGLVSVWWCFSHWFSRHKQTRPQTIRGRVQPTINTINHIH